MRKISLIFISCLLVLLSTGGYPSNAQRPDVMIIDESYELEHMYDPNEGPAFLVRYRNNNCTIERMPSNLGDPKVGEEPMYNFSDGHGVSGRGRNGVFLIWTYALGTDIPLNVNIIDTHTTKINRISLFNEGIPFGSRLLVNSLTAVRMSDRTLKFFYRDGTPFNIEFDYGEMGYIKNYNWYNAQYYPVNLEYSFARKQYVVIYSRSPYSNTKEGNVKKDTTQCTIGVAVFDNKGKLVKQFPLTGLYYFDSIPDSLNRTDLSFHYTPVYFPEEEPNSMYIAGLIEQEHVKEDYTTFDIWTLDEGDTKRSYVKIDLENDSHKIISKKQYFKYIKEVSYPFIIERYEKETRLKSKIINRTLAVLNGDYVPVDYSDNPDGSFEMIFALENA